MWVFCLFEFWSYTTLVWEFTPFEKLSLFSKTKFSNRLLFQTIIHFFDFEMAYIYYLDQKSKQRHYYTMGKKWIRAASEIALSVYTCQSFVNSEWQSNWTRMPPKNLYFTRKDGAKKPRCFFLSLITTGYILVSYIFFVHLSLS